MSHIVVQNHAILTTQVKINLKTMMNAICVGTTLELAINRYFRFIVFEKIVNEILVAYSRDFSADIVLSIYK